MVSTASFRLIAHITLFVAVSSCLDAVVPNYGGVGNPSARSIRLSSSTFYNYTDMLGSYITEMSTGNASRCPKEFKFSMVSAPDLNESFSYQLPYFKIFADGDACAPWPGPFLAQYSFLENAEYIPGDLLNRLEAFPIAQSLRKKFAEAKTIALGGRAFFGYDVSSRRCGDYEFKGLNGDVITVTIFFAHKELITVDTQGNFNAGRKHMTMIMRDASSTVTMCSYSASHNYWNGKSIPAQKLNPSPTPSHTPTNTPTPSVTPSKGSPPSPTPRAASGSVSSSSSTSSCFPASALVFLLNGSIRSMSDLQIGDQVLVGAEKHSPVFMFTHRLTNGTFEFLRFVFEDASDLRVTPGHYLYANGILKAARDVSVGDKLEKVTGDSTTISCIETVYETGLYNPQTEQGDIVVNGIRVSTYTESISPNAAHAFLSAFRFAHRYMDLTCRSMENGLDFSVI